ncbi:hypothetical protein BGAL_0251g00010 [Botrytis galanthina]|uniref:Uncharacterized protein n=1 Tax=Botrytis galanthina TaxID=278940 RepID=A0A4S8QVE4_9HELO|nr:hypothetical protein BGAL_0251g00010 [Botrytis galanthina]
MPNQTRDYGDLRVTMTADYHWAWDNNKYGTHRGCTFWNPTPQGDMRTLGTVCVGKQNYWARNWRGTILFGPNPNSTSANPAVKRPTDYTRLWWENNDHSWHMGSVWRPIAPAGYVALGDLMVNSNDKPSLDYLWCLRADLVKPAIYYPSDIWNDRGSGRSADISIWAVIPEAMGINGNAKIPLFADTFIHSNTYSPPHTGLAFVPVLDLGNEFQDFDQSIPSFSKTSIPSTGKTYAVVEQAAVTLPMRCFFWSEDPRIIAQIEKPFISISKAIAWYVEGVYENGGSGSFTREQRIKSGISTTQSETMEHQVGISITASHGFKLAEMSVTLNYQFTHTQSTSFTEFTETEITQRFEVPPKTCTVLFSKHVYMKGTMNNGGTILSEIEAVANEDVHLGGCNL